VNKARKETELPAATSAWRRRSAVKPLRGFTRSSMVSCAPLDHEVTVKGCVCIHDHRLTDGIHRLIYCPGSSLTGRGKRTRTWAALTTVPCSLDSLALNDTMALGEPRPANRPFRYSRIISSESRVSPKVPNATKRYICGERLRDGRCFQMP
jgi:hypothetical protein